MEQLREDAKTLIDDLRVNNGGLTPKHKEFLKQEPQILKSINSLRKQLGGSAKILAEQLYTKDARFVYELIQNAEDNRYPLGVRPSLSFALQEDRIIVDSNESGFTKGDVVAISKIGQSTKKCQQGYIGEKGIGFKAVFKVARKVHVQSEPYSFAFESDEGDEKDDSFTGLWMVTPIHEERLPVPEGVQTRMILYLRDDCDRSQLKEDFLNLPDTLLLFLRTLKQLSINIDLPDQPQTHITFSLRSHPTDNLAHRVVIRKRVNKKVYSRSYLIKKRGISDMPPHSAREGITTAEVVIAFPLDPHDIPIIEDQYVFAFLPLRKEKFKFLIQSDFITSANREDVTNCPWNTRLLEEVLETFRLALGDPDGFLQHSTLKYSWVRYIPVTSMTNEFWRKLQRSIREYCTGELFFSRGNDLDSLKRPSELRIVAPNFKDQNSEPLLKDLISGDTAYISEGYNSLKDLSVLKELGVTYLSVFPDFLGRFKQDVEGDGESRWRREESKSYDWFPKVSKILLEAMKLRRCEQFIWKLNIIPLCDLNWVSPNTTNIFFPTSGGVDIPSNLPLSLVSYYHFIFENGTDLLKGLGVTECTPTKVLSLIEQRYSNGGSISTYHLFDDIKFLFCHNDVLPKKGYSLYLAANNGEGSRYQNVSSGGWIYCPEQEDTYSTFKLLDGKVPNVLKEEIRFPLMEYYDTLKGCGLRNNINGPDWLRSRAGIKVTPQLHNRNDPSEMSAELIYISESLPQHLLGVLKKNWAQYHLSDEWDSKLKATQIPILDSQELRALDKTFLPLPKLKAVVQELGLKDSFGFIKELDGMTDTGFVEWGFLERFNVGMNADVSFWIALLRLARYNKDIEQHHIFNIYSHLQTFIAKKDVEALRATFEDQLIYIPPGSPDSISRQGNWTLLRFCLWNGPRWFTLQDCLHHVPEYASLHGFLVDTLQLRNVHIGDYLQYLKWIKALELDLTFKKEDAKIPLLYQELSKLVSQKGTGTEKNQVRCYLEEQELIYLPKNQSWHSPSACVWALEEIVLPGKASIATAYKDQESFFRKGLGIEEPSLKMHILALIKRSSDNPQKESVLGDMRIICALSPKPELLWHELSTTSCFPVRAPSGKIQWLSCSDSFAIVDRAEYGDMFRDRIFTLDFSLEQAHDLKPLFLGLKLESKYLSNLVVEETRVEGGVLDSALTENLRRKAYAISRYAAHLGAPKPATTYSTLQNLKVLASESISKVVSIIQNRKCYKIPGDVAYFHIAREGTQLNLYVPKNRREQQICLARHLPIRLLKEFGIQNDRKGAELGAIITASSLFVVDEILKQDGIIEIAGISRPENDLEEDSFGKVSEVDNTVMGKTMAPKSFRSSDSESFSMSLVGALGTDKFIADLPFHPPTSVFSRSSSQPERPELYKEFLNMVIQQAESLYSLPKVEDSLKGSKASRGTLDCYKAIQSGGPLEETFLIGAAGELFIFEFLKKLSLPNFGINCWQSSIRHLVTVHSQYAEMKRWHGEETGDIVYHDAKGVLTDLLIKEGYLESGSWTGSTPTYYIEVKATMGPLDKEFFCSQVQFDKMEKMQLPDKGSSTNVYLIARVFEMGSPQMGLQLYLDPARLRKDGKLVFFADRYSIRRR